MNIDMQTIRDRHAVRAFTTDPIPSNKAEALRQLIDECNRESGLHLQLVTDDADAFVKVLARYGQHKNARNYVALVGPREEGVEQRLGYYGEKVVLLAQQIGLNTCWIGLTYRKGKAKCRIGEGEKLYGVISVGFGQTQGTAHKVKSPQQICPGIDQMPEWFRSGVDCALLAPTAMNQQKFRFELLPDGRVRARTGRGFFTQMDLGIAQLHFEIGAGDHPVQWEEGI